MLLYGALDTAAFNSLAVPVKFRSQKSLLEEESQEQNQATHKENTPKNTSQQVVIFEDSISGNRFGISISKENFQRLKEKFDSNNFYALKSGEIRLNGEAEAYVGGWFGEVAYNMGAFQADKDRNGKFSQEEKEQIKSGVYLPFRTEYEDSIVYDFRVDKYRSSENLQYGSIDEILDSLIFKDKNLDGAVSLVEHFGTQGLYQALAEIIKSCECKRDDKLDAEKLLRKLENSKQNKDEISKEEAIALLHRLKQGGNIESLTLKE